MEARSDRPPDGEIVESFLELWDRDGEGASPDAFLAAHPGANARDRLDILLVDQSRRHRGPRPRAIADYLASFPDLAADPEAWLDLAFGEYRARRAGGEAIDPVAFTEAFPEAIRRDLAWQLRLHEGLRRPDPVSFETPDHVAATPGSPAEAACQGPADPEGYALGELLGVGGMGEVYRAIQLDLNKAVALKFLRREVVTPAMIDRFRAEGEAVARLRHPNIVAVHRIVTPDNGVPFLVMDLVEGESLEQRIQSGALGVADAVAVVIQVAEAVEDAHARDIIHRDIKPSNVLLDRAGRVRVTDFGLAKSTGLSVAPPDESGLVIGTLAYMAPEQADPTRGPVTPRTDVYGLGGLLFALLIGRPPLTSRTPRALLAELTATGPPPSPKVLSPGLPTLIDDLCSRCLEKDPAARPGSAREVARSLRAWQELRHHPAPGGDLFRSTPLPTKPVPVHRRPILLATLVGLAGGAWLLAARRGSTPIEPPKPSDPIKVERWDFFFAAGATATR